MATNNNIEYVGRNTIERIATNIAATYALKNVFGAASASANGSTGLVPAPTAGNQLKFLRADGTWATPTNTTYTLSSFSITATAAELNILDGATINVTELNYLKGVTSNIQTQLNGKAAASHGTHVTYGTSTPAANGTASAGSASSVSRSDHVHPLQTTVSGNAGSATKLATARKLTIGSTGKDFNGTSALSWTLAEIGAAAATHTHTTSEISDIANKVKTNTLEVSEILLTSSVNDAKHNIEIGEFGVIINNDHPDGQTLTISNYDISISNTVSADISGNAGTATKLKSKVALKIGSTSKDFDGSSGLTWTLAEIGAAAASHGTHVTYATAAPAANGTASAGSAANVARGDHVHPLQTTVSGNAGTATKLKTARALTIGSTAKDFDGSAAVSWTLEEIGAAAASHGTHVSFTTTTPKAAGTAAVGTATTVSRSDHVHPLQTTVSGNAGSATKLATARKLTIGSTGKTFDGSAAVSWTLAEIGAAAASHTHAQYFEAGGVAISVDDSAVIAAVTSATSA